MLDHIRTAAMLHDIGKIGIPDGILLKPGDLSEREMEIMKSHSLIGAHLLRTAGFPEDVVAIVRHLHERYDGWGYPGGLKGDAVPLGSRILAVADTYEAMTSDRIYRAALDPEQAFDELRRFSGSQFDPSIVEAFISQAESLRPQDQQDEAVLGSSDPAEVFSTLATTLINRFGEFAGTQVVGTILDRLVMQAKLRSWKVSVQDGRIEVEAPDLHGNLEARRQVLGWLVSSIEELGGMRIALHLLTEAVEGLTPSARDVYRVLLAPAPVEELAGSYAGGNGLH